MEDNAIKRISFCDIVLLFVCLFLTFKQLNVFFPPLYTVGVLLAGCLLLLFITKNRLRDVSIIWFVVYAVVLVLNFLAGDSYFDSIGDVIQEIAILFFTSTLSYYVFAGKYVRFAKVLIYLILAIITYYSVSSFILEQEFPGIIRNTVYMTNLGELDDLRIYYMSGLATYQLPHALPILIPPLVMVIRQRSNPTWERFLGGIVLIAVFIITFISYAATALFLSILMLLLALIVRQGSIKDNIARLAVVGIIFLPIIISPSFILRPLSDLFSTAEDASYIDKLIDIQKLADSGTATGSVAARESRYDITFDEIIEHPILGTNEQTGDHSAIFDRWASLGLVGWIPYIVFIALQFKAIKKRISKEARPYYVLGVFAALFMLFTKNMSNWETWFMVFTILPLMTWLQSQKTIKTITS